MEQAHSQTHGTTDRIAEQGQIISIDRGTRWQVRQRLQELDIVCDCLADGSLSVVADTPVALMQIRSVLQQWSMSRQVLAGSLEKCWKISG